MNDPRWDQDLDNPEVVARLKSPLQAEVERLRRALTALRAGIIRHAKDTVWFGMGETAVDFITSTLGDADKCICANKIHIGCPIHDPL